MNTQEFFTKYNGKGVDEDGAFGDQCVDIVMRYSKEVQGNGYWGSGNAVGRWTTYPKDKYDRIANTVTNVPKLGDIMIWGTQVGQYGHIAIFSSGGQSTFTSFDQNWPVGSKCHYQSHNYNGVLGWLRSKVDITPPPANDNGMDVALEQFRACFITWVTRWPNDDETREWRGSGKPPWQFIQDKFIYPDLARRDSDYQTLKRQTDAISAEVNEARNLISNLQGQITKINEDNARIIAGMTQEIADKNTEIEKLKSGSAESLSVGDLFRLIIDKLFPKKS